MRNLTNLLVKRALRTGPKTELKEHGETIKRHLAEAKREPSVTPSQFVTGLASGISADHGKEIASETGVSQQRGEQVYYEALPHFEELLKLLASLDEDMVKQARLTQDKEGYKLVSRKDPKKVLKRWTHKPSAEAVKKREDEIEMFKAMDKGASLRSLALTELQMPEVLDKRTYRKAMLRLSAMMPIHDLARSIISNLDSKLKPEERVPSEQLKQLVEQQVTAQPSSYDVYKMMYPSIAGPLISQLHSVNVAPVNFFKALKRNNFDFTQTLAEIMGVPKEEVVSPLTQEQPIIKETVQE